MKNIHRQILFTLLNKQNKQKNQTNADYRGTKFLKKKKSYLLIQSKEHTFTNVNPAYTNNLPVNTCSQT